MAGRGISCCEVIYVDENTGTYSVFEYGRMRAREYARRWAHGRNPLFYNFAGIGGDCTNFVSQCILAGCCTMNYTPTFGWYYRSLNDRTPSWSGVQYLYDFLTNNTGAGPFGRQAGIDELQLGDIVQLGSGDGSFYHTLLITGFSRRGYLVSAHSGDAYDRLLTSYSYRELRPIHIEGYRSAEKAPPECFWALYEGRALPG